MTAMQGSGAEEIIGLACRRLEQDGRAFIRQTHPPTGQTADGHRFFKRGGAVDFFGFTPDGRGLMFDVKSTRTGQFTWAERAHTRGTKDRQVTDLIQAGKFNVLSGLVIVFWVHGQVKKLVSRDQYDRLAWIPWWFVRTVSAGAWTPRRMIEAQIVTEAAWSPGGDPDFLTAAQWAEEHLRPKPSTWGATGGD